MRLFTQCSQYRGERRAIRLEGCAQCVRLSNITFEAQAKGIYIDSYASGITIDIENIWNYDTKGHSEVLRIVNGRGISVRNVMGLDHPSTIFIGKEVSNIRLENILAKVVIVEDAARTRPILSNVSAVRVGDRESMIEDAMGDPKDLR